VTDEEGYFSIRSVPHGRYTILSENGRVFSGEVKSGWQRLLAPEVDTGEHVDIAGVSPPAFTPPPSPIAATNTPVDTPTHTYTPTDEGPSTSTDTPIATPNSVPTDTPQPVEISAVLGQDVEVTFRDEFEGTTLSSDWNRSTNVISELRDGQLVLAGSIDQWEYVSRDSFGENEGYLILFRDEDVATIEMTLHRGSFGQSNYRDWGVGKSDTLATIFANDGDDTTEPTLASVDLKSDTWYYLLQRIGDDGQFSTFVWERDDPSKYVVNYSATPLGVDGSQGVWGLSLYILSGTWYIETYEELRFPSDYVMPDLPPIGNAASQVPIPEQAMIYEEDFDSIETGIPQGWNILTGEVEIRDEEGDNKVLYIGPSNLNSYQPPELSGNYTIELDFKLSSTPPRGFLSVSLRYQPNSNCPETILWIGNENIQMLTRPTQDCVGEDLIGGNTYNNSVNVWHSLRIEVDSGRATVYVDNQMVVTGYVQRLEEEAFLGIGTWDFTSLWIDNLRIWHAEES
jgi:hypothetical protein